MAIYCLKCGAVRYSHEEAYAGCAYCFAAPFASCRAWNLTGTKALQAYAHDAAEAAKIPSKGARAKANKRRRVYERDGHKCVRCGSKSNLTLDHIVPRSKGGSNREDNLQTMCRKCNARKADRIEPVPAMV